MTSKLLTKLRRPPVVWLLKSAQVLASLNMWRTSVITLARSLSKILRKRYTQSEILSKTIIRNVLFEAVGIIKYAERTERGVTARGDPLVGGRNSKGGPGLEVIVVQGIGDFDLPAVWNYDFDFCQNEHLIRRRIHGPIPEG